MLNQLNIYEHLIELISDANNLEELYNWVIRERMLLQIKIKDYFELE